MERLKDRMMNDRFGIMTELLYTVYICGTNLLYMSRGALCIRNYITRQSQHMEKTNIMRMMYDLVCKDIDIRN